MSEMTRRQIEQHCLTLRDALGNLFPSIDDPSREYYWELLDELGKTATLALTARSEGFREGVEASKRLCDAEAEYRRLRHDKPLPGDADPTIQAHKQVTAHKLGQAISALSSRETDADAQIPHGVCRADDPNREATGIGSGDSAAHRPSAIGVAPSVSDDSAGTRISVASAPPCRLPKGCEAPEMCEELNRCTAKAQPSAPSTEVAEMVRRLNAVSANSDLCREAAALLSKVGQTQSHAAVNWTTEGCPKHHGQSWIMSVPVVYTEIGKRCPICNPPPPERP